jgi:hypothetical protein
VLLTLKFLLSGIQGLAERMGLLKLLLELDLTVLDVTQLLVH